MNTLLVRLDATPVNGDVALSSTAGTRRASRGGAGHGEGRMGRARVRRRRRWTPRVFVTWTPPAGRRRAAGRRGKRTRRAAWALVLAAAAAAGGVAVAPEARRYVQGHAEALGKGAAPAVQWAADWLARSVSGVRNALGQRNPVAQLSGPARVVDGDSLTIRETRIRLHGIDAPESVQRCRADGRSWRCGREATRALSGRIAGRRVVCEERDRDRYGRLVALCWVGGGELNAWMVAEGWAFAYRAYSVRYLTEEWAAKAAGRGIWRSDVVPPWEWRKGRRLEGE